VVISAAMMDVRANGTRAARHLRGEIFEVRAFARDRGYRILFAEEGRHGQVLLSLHAIRKQTQKTPAPYLDLAERRLRDWRERGRQRRRGRRGYA
jgi:phage-related protein